MTLPNKTEHRAIVDTHRHPIGPKLAAKMAEAGLYDPNQPFPQANDKDLICYREFFDLDYAMPKQREEGVTLSLASNGGEVEWFARDMLQVSSTANAGVASRTMAARIDRRTDHCNRKPSARSIALPRRGTCDARGEEVENGYGRTTELDDKSIMGIVKRTATVDYIQPR
jgi:hypothetical protein